MGKDFQVESMDNTFIPVLTAKDINRPINPGLVGGKEENLCKILPALLQKVLMQYPTFL